MTSGIQIFNEANTVQIDDTYSNYRLTGKAVHTSSQGLYAQGSEVAIAVHGLSSLVAIQTGARHCLASITNEGRDDWKLSIALDASPGTLLTAYHFSAAPPESTRCGMQIFDERGALRFDAASRFLRIQRLFSGDYRHMFGDHALPHGRSYATVFSKWAGTFQSFSNYPASGGYPSVHNYYGAPGISISGATLKVNYYSNYMFFEFPWFGGPHAMPPPAGRTYPDFMLMIADVTGY